MKKIKNILSLFLTYLLFSGLVYAQEDEEGSFEVTSERTDFGIDKINLTLSLNNKDLGHPLQNASIQVTDTLGNSIFEERGIKAQKTLELDINQKYNINIKEQGFQDTTITLSTVGDRIINQSISIGLNPIKIIAEFEITDFDTGNSIEVDVALTNQNREETIVVNLEKNQKRFTARLYAEDDYEMNVKRDDYFLYYDEFSPKGKNIPLKEIKLVYLKIENKISLDRITFAKSSAVLNEQSKKELDRVVELMNDNPTLKLEVAGHTDDVGSAQENLILSQSRVDNVLQYLLYKGINSKRLSGKGYGESEPLFPNDSEENKAKNRRFELIVIDI